MNQEPMETGLTVSGPAEIIKISQLPAIEQNLREVKEWVEKTVAGYVSQAQTAESLQEVKAYRTMLNNMFAEFDNRRKEIKREILAPVDQFEATFKECITVSFKNAVAELTGKINAEESRMKTECEAGLRDFFRELAQARCLDFLRYEQAGIAVSMADAKAKTQPPQKLRERLEDFVECVSNDVDMIATLEDRDEVMAVYKDTLSVTIAISAVKTRHERERLAREENERREAQRAQEAEVAKKVEAFMAPVVAPAVEAITAQEMRTVSFTITDTRERLILLRQYLQANGYNYT